MGPPTSGTRSNRRSCSNLASTSREIPARAGIVGTVTTVVLAEDTLIVREALRALLDAADEVEVLDVCEDYDELLSAVEEHRPDVVITDIRMPPTRSDEGIRAAREIRGLPRSVGGRSQGGGCSRRGPCPPH